MNQNQNSSGLNPQPSNHQDQGGQPHTEDDDAEIYENNDHTGLDVDIAGIGNEDEDIIEEGETPFNIVDVPSNIFKHQNKFLSTNNAYKKPILQRPQMITSAKTAI